MVCVGTCSRSSICFIWGKPAALWANIWRNPPGRELRKASSQQPVKKWGPWSNNPRRVINSINSQVRNLGSSSSLVEASDEITAPVISSTTTSWDTWVRSTKLCCTQIPDSKKLWNNVVKQLSFRGIYYAGIDNIKTFLICGVAKTGNPGVHHCRTGYIKCGGCIQWSSFNSNTLVVHLAGVTLKSSERKN